MKKRMGMFLVALGIFLIGSGGYLILQSIIEKNGGQKQQDVMPSVDYQEEYILEDSLGQAKVDFENYVSSRLNHYHKLIEWKNGGISSSRYKDNKWRPDLIVELDLGTECFPFAIECEWFQQFNDGKLTWAKQEKLEACRLFAEKGNMDVYVALGIGGSANKPTAVYILPLSAAKATLSEAEILNYKRQDNEASLYLDTEMRSLY